MTQKTVSGAATYATFAGHNYQLYGIDKSAITTNIIDVTPYGTYATEYTAGRTDYGTVDMDIIIDSVLTEKELIKMQQTAAIAMLVIIFPTGNEMIADAFISSRKPVTEKDNVYKMHVTFRLTGEPDYKQYDILFIFPPTGSIVYRGSSIGLSINPVSGNHTPGGLATWGITTEHVASGTTIRNSTLFVDSEETNAEIAIIATIQYEGESKVINAAYKIIKPIPTSVTISGDTSINVAKGDQDTNVQYTATVYPTGSNQSCSWKLYDSQGEESKGEGKIVIDKDTGKLTIPKVWIDKQEKPGSFDYSIVATSAEDQYVTQRYSIVVNVTI